MSSIVHVAVGVILDQAAKRVLLARRPDHLHQGGLWEFPGGKLEAGESVQAALQRELHEELAIRVEVLEPLFQLTHNYSDKAVLLDTWLVSEIRGNPQGCEGQEVRWVVISDLGNYQFPAANTSIVEHLQTHYL